MECYEDHFADRDYELIYFCGQFPVDVFDH